MQIGLTPPRSCDILTLADHPTLPKPAKALPCAREQVFGLPSPWFGKMLVAFAPARAAKDLGGLPEKGIPAPLRRRREPTGSIHRGFFPHTAAGPHSANKKAARSDPARSAHGPPTPAAPPGTAAPDRPEQTNDTICQTQKTDPIHREKADAAAHAEATTVTTNPPHTAATAAPAPLDRVARRNSDSNPHAHPVAKNHSLGGKNS